MGAPVIEVRALSKSFGDGITRTVGDITYIRTDADLPPVAVIDRSPISGRHRMIFGLVAVLGATVANVT